MKEKSTWEVMVPPLRVGVVVVAVPLVRVNELGL